VATLIERGEVGARVSLFADDRDVAVVTRLVNRVVLGLLGDGRAGVGAAAGGSRRPQLTGPPRCWTCSATADYPWPPCSSCESSWQPREKCQR